MSQRLFTGCSHLKHQHSAAAPPSSFTFRNKSTWQKGILLLGVCLSCALSPGPGAQTALTTKHLGSRQMLDIWSRTTQPHVTKESSHGTEILLFVLKLSLNRFSSWTASATKWPYSPSSTWLRWIFIFSSLHLFLTSLCSATKTGMKQLIIPLSLYPFLQLGLSSSVIEGIYRLNWSEYSTHNMVR